MQLLDIDKRCVVISFTPEELKFIAEACNDAAPKMCERRTGPGQKNNVLLGSWCETVAVGFEAASLAAGIYSHVNYPDVKRLNLTNLRDGKLLDPI